MNGTMIARDWLLLGAESLLALPEDAVVSAHQGFPVHAERWAVLAQMVRAHTAVPSPSDALLQRLCGELGLSDRSYWVLMLAAAVELYPEAAAAASILAEDERLHLLTPVTYARLVHAALDVGFEDALCEALPSGPARRLGLIEALEVIPGRPGTQQGIRLRGEELSALVSGGRDLAASHALAISRARAATTAYPTRMALGAAALLDGRGLLALRCESSRGSRQFALDVATVQQKDALFVASGDTLPELAELGRLRARAVVVLDLSGWPGERAFPLRFVAAAAELLASLIVLVPNQASTGELPAFAVPPLGRDEARQAWAEVLSDADDVAELANRFRLGMEEARLAVAEAEQRAAVEGDRHTPARERIARAVLSQGSRRMGRAVTHVTSNARLAELMVPPPLRDKIRDIIGWYRTAARVERDYRTNDAGAKSAGLACLFSGQPGTGKTFAAQCIANELALNLYRIDLSQVVSKYIGETEKALALLFDEAEAGHGVLLFDEADALFGKRTEVKDAHDRYANVEVGYLLQRVESFSGIAVLTTNLRNNIDSAFTRRLRFVLEFPVPGPEQRRELWERALPAPHLRHRDLELAPFIERFRLSGGHIHNIGLAATHLAAATPEGLVGHAELVQATSRELEKAGLARSAAEFGPLAAWLPGKEAQ
jgi:hypothetical protein